ncbi:hypothetical protein [Desulfovibrio sp. JC022]|uniref:hypothetical protein n=1 Tax=Desulfovibrio sp. JC022 TaxID=2593642 RepID=UPI0013D7E5D2|nr:hypothetical protein [Desulfovibrio sp. JC022]NDV24709.1 hypothetical protein [Desulfovibrio sp. JC022]
MKFFVKYFAIILTMLTFVSMGAQTSYASENQAHSSFNEISDKNEAFYAGYFQVVGHGEGDSKSMALLAARSVAQARLVEIINGLQVERQTLVRNGKIKQDIINLKSHGVIRFASVCGEKYSPKSGEAEVCLRLTLRSGGLGDLVKGLVDDVK